MGDNLSSLFVRHLEHDVQLLSGLIAIDGSRNVIGQAPITAPVGPGPYSFCKGVLNSVGLAGAVKVQPYQSTGFYQFTLDSAWYCLLDWRVNLLEQGAVAIPTAALKANVRATQNGSNLAGVVPGTDVTLPAQTIQIKFRLPTTGALTDIAVSTGFWLSLFLKRSGTP